MDGFRESLGLNEANRNVPDRLFLSDGGLLVCICLCGWVCLLVPLALCGQVFENLSVRM